MKTELKVAEKESAVVQITCSVKELCELQGAVCVAQAETERYIKTLENLRLDNPGFNADFLLDINKRTLEGLTNLVEGLRFAD